MLKKSLSYCNRCNCTDWRCSRWRGIKRLQASHCPSWTPLKRSSFPLSLSYFIENSRQLLISASSGLTANLYARSKRRGGIKADSHILCRSPAMPRVHRSESDLSRPRQGRGRGKEWYVWIGIGRPGRHVGDLTAFGTVGEWQGSGRVAAGERHAMCESALSSRYEKMYQYLYTFSPDAPVVMYSWLSLQKCRQRKIVLRLTPFHELFQSRS
jgi:hypothetical protein